MSRWRSSIAAASLRVVPAALLLFAPQAVHACAVCFGGQEGDTRMAFILTTVFLTFLPLLMIGGVVWWFRRRFRQLELEEAGAMPHGRGESGRSGADAGRASGIPSSLDSTAA